MAPLPHPKSRTTSFGLTASENLRASICPPPPPVRFCQAKYASPEAP